MTDEWGREIENEPWASRETVVLLGLVKKAGGGIAGLAMAVELAVSMGEDLKKALAEMTEDRDRWQVKAEGVKE